MVSVHFARGLGAAGFAAAILAAAPALAQQQRPPAQQPAQQQPAQQPAGSAVVTLKGDPNQAEWTKVCGKDPSTQRDTCYTTRDFVAENDTPVLAVAVYETKGEGNRVDRQVWDPLESTCRHASLSIL